MLIYRANLPTSQTLLIDVTASQIDLVIVQLGLSLTTTFSCQKRSTFDSGMARRGIGVT